MRIAIFCPGVTPPKDYGGTERVVYWLGEALTSLGHELIVIAPPGSQLPFAKKVIEFPLPQGNINASQLELEGLLKEAGEDVDILHIHCATPSSYNLPVLKTVHGYPFHYTGREEWACKEEFGEEYSFISKAHAATCGWPQAAVVYNGLNPNEYIYSEKKSDYLLFLGKVDWNVKGLPFALRLAREGKYPLKIAGVFMDKDFYKRELKPEIDKINFSGGNVEYVGPVAGQGKAQLLSQARALVHFALWPEPFGLLIIEALVSGTPVLCTPNGAMPELMLQGVSGYMGRSFQETMGQVEMLKNISPQNCRKRVLENFTAKHMAEGYLKLYLNRIKSFARGCF